ncbi:zincin-like metallopeptidase domain-containing protein [Mucilaginibacter sp. PAMB04274]|uniref:ArdC family protein n=1 Tax=Mucilaginibacter sp. PAMB04274 TaxID=3138568 RepID=UPI0031F6035D
MDNNKKFKPFHVQIAEKLSAELKEGTSFFQKPVKENGMPSFVAPVNPITGKGYSALNAISLALKRHDDPRWMSAESARFAGFWVKPNEKGTMISFPKKSDIEAIRAPDGSKITDEQGKTQTKVVEFEKPKQEVAFLFNATQIRDFTPLEEFLAKKEAGVVLSPLERAEQLIQQSGAVIIHGGQEANYDKIRDAIFLPEKDQFKTEAQYYQAAIHQLVHWSGHETRLNRPMEGKFGSVEYGKEELRAAIGAMLIGAELKVGHAFGPHAAYSGNWIKMLKEDPYEISRAVKDAQRAASKLLGMGEVREQKQVAANSKYLEKGEEVAYNDTVYKVLDKKRSQIEVEKADTGEKIKVKPSDGLYKNLVEARNNSGVKQEAGQTQDIAVEPEVNYNVER